MSWQKRWLWNEVNRKVTYGFLDSKKGQAIKTGPFLLTKPKSMKKIYL